MPQNRRIYKRPDQQKYTLGRHIEFCKADRTTRKLTLAIHQHDTDNFITEPLCSLRRTEEQQKW